MALSLLVAGVAVVEWVCGAAVGWDDWKVVLVASGGLRAIGFGMLRESGEFADTKGTLLRMLNSMRRSMTARCQNIGRGVFRSPYCRSISTALRSALWSIALVLLGVLAAACSDSPTMTAVPAPMPTATGTNVPSPTLTPTATAVPSPTPNMVAPPDPEEEPALMTHLYPFDSEFVALEGFTGPGGAIESIYEDLLVVTPKGKLALVFRDGSAEYLDGNVPMNAQSLAQHEDYNNHFNPGDFRVADILLKEFGEGRYELFAAHHYFTGECIRFRLSSTTILRDEEGVTVMPDWRTIFDAEPCLPLLWFTGHESGGKMLTDGADHLLVIIGAHGVDSWRARPTFDPTMQLGKFVRIAIETGEVETLAIGFRNSQGMVRDADGNIWATDHGPQGGDELNLLERGGNYGWPVVSYGVQYGRQIPPTIEDEKMGRHDDFVRPVFSWVPSPAISAIAVNDEEHLPLWKDDLLIASFVTGSLYRVRRHGTDVQYVEKLELGYRIRDIAIMQDGRIALLRDGGRVYFLSRSLRYCDEESRERRDVYSASCDYVVASPTPDSSDTEVTVTPTPSATEHTATPTPSATEATGTDETVGSQLFGLHCGSCHNLNAEEHGPGPHLVGVIGRTAGEVGGFSFSEALRSSDVVWTRDSITQFLIDPQQFAPGTSMSSSDITEEEARAIADYLAGVAVMPDDTPDTVGDSQPAIHSDFDVHLTDNRLIYTKEQCAEDDTAATFFLHIDPIDVEDLPDDRKQHGFDNMDFGFERHGEIVDGDCVATVPLPDYDIAAIRTGQYVPVDGGFQHLWEGEIRLDCAAVSLPVPSRPAQIIASILSIHISPRVCQVSS